MFDKQKIILFGEQPIAKVTDKILDNIILRDFGSNADIVKLKLDQVSSDTKYGKNRISAAILKLANMDIYLIDNLIKKSINDFRDVVSIAEYPRCSKLDFDVLKSQDKKQVILDDWNEYSNWLKD